MRYRPDVSKETCAGDPPVCETVTYEYNANDQLLTETDNPGALKWLKKSDEVGMPTAIKKVVEALATLRNSTPERIEQFVHASFSRLIADEPWFRAIGSRFFQ